MSFTLIASLRRRDPVMKSSPAVEIPADLLDRWRALQQLRVSKAVGRCDCQCRRCSMDDRNARSQPGS
jgi:hypothetical protein